MLGTSLDFPTLAIVVAGALVAGFTTGFAGFGTGLVASGLWFHALPAAMVPPLVALASVAAQLVGLVTVRKAFDWPRAAPYLLGGTIGVPLGITALAAAMHDSYQRHGSKKARNWPHKKRELPPGDPKIVLANATQQRRAKNLTEKNDAA